MASLIKEIASVSTATRPVEAAPGTVFGAADALIEPSSNGSTAEPSLRREPSVAEELDVAEDENENAATRLYRVLKYNKEFVDAKQYLKVKRSKLVKAHKKAIVVTCMDARLIRLLPHALNFHEGDAKIIKNAGAIITHPFGGIMRSIIVALYELGADEIFVIGHHDCGMSKINPKHTMGKMLDAGIKQETLSTLEFAGINIKRWLHGFDSVHESVRNSVAVIRNHPLVPEHVPVHGLIIDPETGLLDLEIDGNVDALPREPRSRVSSVDRDAAVQAQPMLMSTTGPLTPLEPFSHSGSVHHHHHHHHYHTEAAVEAKLDPAALAAFEATSEGDTTCSCCTALPPPDRTQRNPRRESSSLVSDGTFYAMYTSS